MTSVKIGLFTCEKNISIVHTVIDQDGAERVLVIDFIIFMQKYFGPLKTIRTLKIFLAFGNFFQDHRGHFAL